MLRKLAALCALLAIAASSASAAAPGAIGKWVVLGPFPNPKPANATVRPRGGFDTDYLKSLGGEAKAVVKVGATVQVPGGEAAKARAVVSTPGGHVDFAKVYTQTENKLVYCYAEFTSAAEEEALVFLGSDDGAKAWLNGQLVWDVYPQGGRGYVARQDQFKARLVKGVNRLLVKVENGGGGWEVGVEVLGKAAAQPILAEQARAQKVREALNLEIEPLRTYPGYVFDPGPFPRIGWRDAEAARKLVGNVPLKVRWFDAKLNPVATAKTPGRYMAVVEGTMPGGLPLRAGLTFYCKPPDALQMWQQDWGLQIPYLGKPYDEAAWRERSEANARVAGSLFRESIMTTGGGAVFLAAAAEAKPQGRPPLFIESPDVVHCDYQVALKMKLLGRTPTPLAPPRLRTGKPAPVLHEGTLAEAGMKPDAKEKIDAVCRKWAETSGEPFALLVARHGVIVTHEAFGNLAPGVACSTSFRNEVASITKAISGMVFGRFVDQGLASIDEPIGKILPDFPTTGPKALTFRHCFTHTNGFEGHGDFGGIWNPYLDNVLRNWLPVLKPGTKHVYNGMGYDLAGKAMEMITGKSIPRIFKEGLFAPLGLEDAPQNDMAFGAHLTARELGTIAQLMLNKGSYGDKEYMSEATFLKLLPVSLQRFWPAIDVTWGIGLTPSAERRPGAPSNSTDPKDLSLGPRTIGHGSATSCILRVDPDQDLVIAMIRRTAGKDYDANAKALFAAVADGVVRK